MTRFLALIFLAALMQACAPKPSTEPQMHTFSHEKTGVTSYETAEKAQWAFDNDEVVCADAANCPSSVGSLAIRMANNEIDHCSAFLINSDTAATSAHCLPEALRQAGADCKGQLRLTFAKTTKGVTSVGCDKVISVSDYKDTETFTFQRDYALLKLDRPTRRAAYSLNYEGLKNLENIRVVSVRPFAGMRILDVKHCQAVHNTIYLKNGVQKSALMGLVNCDLVSGESGAAVLNQNDQASGIVAATWVKAENSVENPNLGYAMNFSCVSVPGSEDQTGSNNCEPNPGGDLYLRAALERVMESKEVNSLSAQIAKWVAENSSLISWKFVPERPAVFNPDAMLVKIRPQPMCTRGTSIAQVSRGFWQEWGLKTEPNQYYQYALAVHPEISRSYRLEVKSDLVRLQKDPIAAFRYLALDSDAEVFHAPSCEEGNIYKIML